MKNEIFSFIMNSKFGRKKFEYYLFYIPNFIKRYLGIYPTMQGKEIKMIKKVLRTRQWNMGYGKNLMHEKLENSFAQYVGTTYAVAFGTGGVAIQSLLRSLNLPIYSEVMHQVDTCSATPQSIINANLSPRFIDIDASSLMLSESDISKKFTKNTTVIFGTHMWGYPENVAMLKKLSVEHNCYFIEDCCLALGTKYDGKIVGSLGTAGVFSFGSTKPIQAGEGGMIVTNDENLANELKSQRNWGENHLYNFDNDVSKISSNGRMSEVVAAIAYEQLKNYPKRLNRIQENVHNFFDEIKDEESIIVDIGQESAIDNSTFSQVRIMINNPKIKKNILRENLKSKGIPNFHANFQPLTNLSLFKNKTLRKNLPREINSIIDLNQSEEYSIAHRVYDYTGIGLFRFNFESKLRANGLAKNIKKILRDQLK